MTEGRVLAGRYHLGRLLGRGGMAEVYAAHDQVLDREVAIKLLLNRFLDDESFTRRFEDEARHVARLNHPGLVAVYDTGNDQGQPFIVMELVEGRSMQQAIEAGGLTEDRALEVIGDVCSALSYAHSRHLVHRDIKPGNILLADDGAVKVTDFGIARAVDADNVTRTAAVLGTAAYLSPEQAQGQEVDARSDLYSLGVVLYEALTGEPPFTGDSAVTVAYQHVQEPPRPPRDLAPGVSEAAQAVTMQALAKNPANRYQNAEQMRDDIDRARTGSMVSAPTVLTAQETAALDAQPTAEVPTHEQERRRRGLTYTLLALLAIALLAGGVWALTSMGDDEPEWVPVPDVTGDLLADAEVALADVGLEVGEITEETTDEEESGTVLDQSPDPDDEVEVGSAVALTVSVGTEQVAVPNLFNLTEEEATARIRQEGLVPASIEREFSDEVDDGRVIRSNPEAGTEVNLGSQVSYTVSSGEELVSVRHVINRFEADAISLLEELDLEVVVERDFHATIPEGTVISQNPDGGERVPLGTTVTIVVSQGPEEEPEPDPDDEPEPDPDDEPDPEPDPDDEPEPDPDPDDEPEPDPDPDDEPEPDPDDEPEPDPDPNAEPAPDPGNGDGDNSDDQ